jgi:hypothetical protein
MLWIAAIVVVIAGIVATALKIASRPGALDRLGSVSNRWISEHRLE